MKVLGIDCDDCGRLAVTPFEDVAALVIGYHIGNDHFGEEKPPVNVEAYEVGDDD